MCVDGDAVCLIHGHVFFTKGLHLNHAKTAKAFKQNRLR